jgi:hypothetical protein
MAYYLSFGIEFAPSFIVYLPGLVDSVDLNVVDFIFSRIKSDACVLVKCVHGIGNCAPTFRI